ncbi:MAG: sigma-54-dependent Fis family transcriptional regulator [Chthonomonas sp.]|nr:sigma-54-dependent Fis family transcriptional regulator [Chthonomonas sp.]
MSTLPRLLIVDDEANIRRILQVAFEKAGYAVVIAEDAHRAQSAMRESAFQCVISDVTMPGITGYEFQKWVAAEYPDTPFILMTAFGTIPQAIQAIRDGAFEFVTKPFDLENLKRVVAAALSEPGQAPAKTTRNKAKGKQVNFIAESPQMKEIYELVEQVADSRATVLVTGESGAGKEVIANLLHQLSPRSGKPFVACSCAAMPETLLESELFGYEKGAFTGANGSKPGRFELAHNGTLFLDEIGEIPGTIQAKLLRVLQEREFERLGATKPTQVDVRLVTATNRDLQAEVDAGNFRLDLLYRLQVVEIYLPPLRERQADIVPLAEHFLRKFATENERSLTTLSDEAVHALQTHNWPGNVRELSNVIERAVVMSSREATELAAKSLPSQVRLAA